MDDKEPSVSRTAAAFVAGTEERPMARTALAARLRIASGDRAPEPGHIGNAGQPGERRIAAEDFVAAKPGQRHGDSLRRERLARSRSVFTPSPVG